MSSLLEYPVFFQAPKATVSAQLPITSALEIDALLAADTVCAIGVSGGKDSVALGIAVWKHLDEIGHTGPRLLVHADLGVVEWKDSLPSCQ